MRINTEGVDNKNIEGIGLMDFKIFYCKKKRSVTRVLTILSVSVSSAVKGPRRSHEDVRVVLLRFIETYRHLPVVSGVSFKQFSNKEIKNATCDELVTILKEIMKDATREDVENKVSSLGTNYRRKLKKVNILVSGLMMFYICFMFYIYIYNKY
jgi:hypothetical protein